MALIYTEKNALATFHIYSENHRDICQGIYYIPWQKKNKKTKKQKKKTKKNTNKKKHRQKKPPTSSTLYTSED